MFVQVIQGHVTDATKVKKALDQWDKDLAPSAEGWLGTTAGVTADGRFIAEARFEDEDSAHRNSDRPEQDAWFKKMAKLFDDGPTFHDSTDVMVDIVGNPDEAHFVQVMQGRGTDPDRARELMSEGSDEWADFRPDILGSVATQYDDGDYTMVMYFTTEEEAREGERKEPPPALKAQMDEMNSMAIGQPEFFDISDPWLYSRHEGDQPAARKPRKSSRS